MNNSRSSCILLFPAVLLLASCVIPESNHIEPTYHLLSEFQSDRNQTYGTDQVSFYVRQVELPTYLHEKRLVLRPKQGLIEFMEDDRWGEPLEEGIARVLGLNLSKRLNTLIYSVSPHRRKQSCMFDLGITVKRFERVDSRAILLDVLCDLRSTKNIKHVPFSTRVDFGDSDDLLDSNLEVLALSQALSELTDFLVKEVGALQADSSQAP
jgi:uncharacterized lipoprotein YmbA